MQRGHLIEQMAGDFTSRFFMRDFVFLNAEYSSARLKKELADVLLILDEECIVISIKGTDGELKSRDRLKSWLKKKTWEGSKAAKVGIHRLGVFSFAARNLWGETREFAPSSLKPRCGICLLECSQEPFKPIDFEISQPRCEFPIHVLSLNDFLNVVMLLGSIWDVFHYFAQRACILHTFTGINQERPPLAYYTLRSKDLRGFPQAEGERLAELHQVHLLDTLSKYEARDRLGGYVNAVVHELHTRHPAVESYVPPELRQYFEPPEKRTAYLKMAAMLNALPTSNKAYIGRQLEQRLGAIKPSGQQSCFAFKRLNGRVVFVLVCFSKLSRTERMRALHRILPAGLYSYGVREGLGVAFDADDEKSGFDLEWIGGMSDFDEDTQRMAEQLFPEPETSIANPFGEARPYRPTSETRHG